MADGINYTGDLPRYVLDHLFDNLTDKSYWHIDDRNNVDMLRIINRETKSKFQLTIGVFSITFVMSVIDNLQNSWIRWRWNTNYEINAGYTLL